MSCDTETYINNVPVVTCHCALGAMLTGALADPHSSFLISARRPGVLRRAPRQQRDYNTITTITITVWRSGHGVCLLSRLSRGRERLDELMGRVREPQSAGESAHTEMQGTRPKTAVSQPKAA